MYLNNESKTDVFFIHVLTSIDVRPKLYILVYIKTEENSQIKHSIIQCVALKREKKK